MSTESKVLHPTEIAKLEAEIAKLQQETNGVYLENLLKQEVARKEAALADKERAYAETQRLHLASQQRTQELELARNHYHHVYHFNDPVDYHSVEAAISQLAVWDRQAPGVKNPDGTVAEQGCPMHIVINSPGGSVLDGVHLLDDLVGYSLRGGGTHEVTITVRGYAASMAGILLQAADIRRIGKEAYLMIHEISAGAGGKIGDIKDSVKWYDRVCERIANLFVARSGRITLEEFKAKWERQDWWLDSEESLALGFVDEIG